MNKTLLTNLSKAITNAKQKLSEGNLDTKDLLPIFVFNDWLIEGISAPMNKDTIDIYES